VTTLQVSSTTLIAWGLEKALCILDIRLALASAMYPV
jgi:hypothetical protein